ncbi:MAG TPA: class I SAM-dependent methyltransferase [Haliangiales bacterium]|nr:class I SAM-dependent methyltransferase [Haliangiales bacterium]
MSVEKEQSGIPEEVLPEDSAPIADDEPPPKRKKAGLRVPSDDVPRPHDTQPMAAVEGEVEVDVVVDEEEIAAVPVEVKPTNGSGPHRAASEAQELRDEDLEEVPSDRAPTDPETAPPDEVELSPAEIEEVARPPIPPKPPIKEARDDAPPKPPPAPPRSPPSPGPPPRVVAAAAAAAASAVESRAKRKRTRAWFEEVFDEDYLRTLPFLTPQTTQREATFLVDALAVKPGHHVLDIGCGYGRHAMELAARGFHVTALDLSLALLLRGADEAQRRGLTINFVHGDMRDMTFENQFEGAYCVFSTFGFFDDEMNKKVAAHMARALKPGGRLVLDVLNRDYIAADLPTRVWWEGDGCVVLEEVDFNYFTSRVVSNRSVVFEDGRQLEQEISIRAYALHELGKVLHGAGFRVIEVSGNLAARGRFFGKDSRNLWIIAEKRNDRDPTPVP